MTLWWIDENDEVAVVVCVEMMVRTKATERKSTGAQPSAIAAATGSHHRSRPAGISVDFLVARELLRNVKECHDT